MRSILNNWLIVISINCLSLVTKQYRTYKIYKWNEFFGFKEIIVFEYKQTGSVVIKLDAETWTDIFVLNLSHVLILSLGLNNFCITFGVVLLLQ